jgi:hypothetical protein
VKIWRSKEVGTERCQWNPFKRPEFSASEPLCGPEAAVCRRHGDIQEKRMHLNGFKTGRWWYTHLGRKAKKEILVKMPRGRP